MSAEAEKLETEKPIQLTQGQTEILLKALRGEAYPGLDASRMSETQFIKRQLAGDAPPAPEEPKSVFI